MTLPSDALPLAALPALTSCTLQRVTEGCSGAVVFRVFTPDGTTQFLKTGTGPVGAEIARESEKLRWLGDFVPVPALLASGQEGVVTYQLTGAIPGESAFAAMTRDPAQVTDIVREIAAFLRALHAIPTTSCPFDASHHVRLHDARRNIDAGRVDTDDFDEARHGWTAEQVWDALQQHLPIVTEPVVTHGDFSLDNIFLLDGRVSGCLDVGRLGVADRYQDLAILWNTLGDFGPAAQAALFDAYGIGAPDPQRLEFHLLLDELF